MWLLYTILTILLLPTAAVIAIYASRIRFSRSIVARTVAAQSCPEGCRNTIVVAGDSTAFGVGNVAEQLDATACASADMVLIQAGANDVLELRSVAKVEADLRAAIASARRLSRNIVLMPGHDFSVAPFFLRPISRVIMWHAVKVHAVVKRVIAEEGVIFVDLFRDPLTEPFLREPRRYYCPDWLHPSGEGYAIWFAVLAAQVPISQFLSGSGSD